MKTTSDIIFSDSCENVFRTKEPEYFWNWIDKHYYLPPESSNSDGEDWVSHGYQRSIAFVLWDLDTPEKNIIKGTQLGLSHEVNAFVLYEVVERGRSSAFFLPRNEDSKYYSSVMLTNAIKNSKLCSAALKVEPEKKDTDNTNSRKGFRKGNIFTRSSDSPSAYDQISIKTAVQDEASRMPHRVSKSKDEEGESPFDMIKSRMEAADFTNHICFSSPEEEGTCAIDKLYKASRMKAEQNIPCPHCDHYQPLEFGDKKKSHGMQWEKKTDSEGKRDNLLCAETAWYKCRACQEPITYEQMIEQDDKYGELRSEAVLDDQGKVIEPAKRLSIKDRCYYYIEEGVKPRVAPKPYSIGIRQNSMFSRTKNWVAGVKQYLDAVDALKEGDNSKIMAFTKKYLAYAYKDEADARKVKWESVQKRVEKYCQTHDDLYTYGVPNGVQAIVGWWDLQNDWIQGGFAGYGFREECWFLRNIIKIGDPATTDSLDIVKKMMDHKFIKDDGTELTPLIQGIDSGDRPDIAYDKSLELGRTLIIPTKGSSTFGHPTIVFPESPKNNCKNTFMTMTGPGTIKDLVYGRLTKVEEPGPGYIHFPDNEEFNDEYFKGFTSESKKLRGGRRVYIKDRDRNEPLDIAVGCHAIITIAQLDKFGLNLVQSSEIPQPESTEVKDDVKKTGSIAKRWRKKN